MVSRKSPLMRPLAKNATRPSCSKPSSRSAAVAVSMLPEMRVVGRRAFGDTHQDPVARRGLQPHLEFVALAIVEAHANHRVARRPWSAPVRSTQDRQPGLRPAARAGRWRGSGSRSRCSTSHQERYGESTLKAAIVPARAGLPYLSNMRSAMTGPVRPSATSFEAALSISARTGPPPKCTERSPRQASLPSFVEHARGELVLAIDEIDGAPAAHGHGVRPSSRSRRRTTADPPACRSR